MNNEIVEDEIFQKERPSNSEGNHLASTALFLGTFDYTVEKGDTLWSIAQDTVPNDRASDKHLQQCVINISMENRLADMNHIEVGQKLSIPIPCDASASSQKEHTALDADALSDNVLNQSLGSTNETYRGLHQWFRENVNDALGRK